MKEIIKLGLILFLVTAVAGAVLAFVNGKTQPLIIKQARRAEKRALTEALPTADTSAIVKLGENFYIGYQDPEKEKIAGYIFKAIGKGYSSDIETMVGIDTLGSIVGLKIIKQVETPGLGTKIEEITYGEKKSWFQQQFVGIKQKQIALKPTGAIESITGATISSRAVASSIQKSLEDVLKKIKNSATKE